jgi:hypothetical protein
MPGHGVHWNGCPQLTKDQPMALHAMQVNDEWYRLVSRIALKLNCLPSMFPSENGHIERKLDELIARAGQRT